MWQRRTENWGKDLIWTAAVFSINHNLNFTFSCYFKIHLICCKGWHQFIFEIYSVECFTYIANRSSADLSHLKLDLSYIIYVHHSNTHVEDWTPIRGNRGLNPHAAISKH